jgi:hypothetical protein
MEVAGVWVNVAALGHIKSLADLKKLGIYAHLGPDDQDAAYKELFEVLAPPKAVKHEQD